MCVRVWRRGLTECFLVTQGTQQEPLVDKCVPDTCLFIGLQIFRTRSKNFYSTISQVRFLCLKSQALTHRTMKILESAAMLALHFRFLPQVPLAL